MQYRADNPVARPDRFIKFITSVYKRAASLLMAEWRRLIILFRRECFNKPIYAYTHYKSYITIQIKLNININKNIKNK